MLQKNTRPRELRSITSAAERTLPCRHLKIGFGCLDIQPSGFGFLPLVSPGGPRLGKGDLAEQVLATTKLLGLSLEASAEPRTLLPAHDTRHSSPVSKATAGRTSWSLPARRPFWDPRPQSQVEWKSIVGIPVAADTGPAPIRIRNDMERTKAKLVHGLGLSALYSTLHTVLLRSHVVA